MAVSCVVPPLPPKLRRKPQPCDVGIGKVYANVAELASDLAVWHAEIAERAEQVKVRRQAQEKLREQRRDRPETAPVSGRRCREARLCGRRGSCSIHVSREERATLFNVRAGGGHSAWHDRRFRVPQRSFVFTAAWLFASLTLPLLPVWQLVGWLSRVLCSFAALALLWGTSPAKQEAMAICGLCEQRPATRRLSTARSAWTTLASCGSRWTGTPGSTLGATCLCDGPT